MEILSKLNELLQYMVEVFGSELFLVGAAFMYLHCFFGYQLLRVWSTIIGMLLGGAIGVFFGINMEWTVPATITITLIAALALGWVFYQIYMAGIFAIFAGAAFAAFFLLSPDMSMALKIIFALIVGAAGTLCVRPLIIVLSAILGGVSGSLLMLAAFNNYETNTLIIVSAITIVAGIICQFFFTAPIKIKGEEEEEENIKQETPVIKIPQVEPIESIQPEEILQNKDLPSSEEIDRMIEEQLQSTSFEGITQSGEVQNDFAVEDDKKDTDLEDIPDDVIDEMIVQAIPDAEEYLNPKEIINDGIFTQEENLSETKENNEQHNQDDKQEEKQEDDFSNNIAPDDIKTGGDYIFDINAQNDFEVTPDENAQEDEHNDFISINNNDYTGQENLSADFRSASEVEQSISALEESMQKDEREKKKRNLGHNTEIIEDLQFKSIKGDDDTEK